MINVFVMIGNSDDKLTQFQWSTFISDVRLVLTSFPVIKIWGELYCLPNIMYQNACWHIGIANNYPLQTIKDELVIVSRKFGQDAIAWIECKDAEFLDR